MDAGPESAQYRFVHAIGSPETYRLLVIDRGWSGPRFERWYAETLERLLLEPAPA